MVAGDVDIVIFGVGENIFPDLNKDLFRKVEKCRGTFRRADGDDWHYVRWTVGFAEELRQAGMLLGSDDEDDREGILECREMKLFDCGII